MPDSSDNYQLPSWPPTAINRDLWNAVMGSIGDRLRAREELEADFEALIAQGTQASLDYIQATVAPQVASLQTSIELAQEQIDQIIVDGIAPNAAKLGGQLPAFYAPASVLPLKADVTYVDSEMLDLATAIQILLDQKAGLTETTNALSKRTRVDAAQAFTQAERGQARANIDGGVLAGFRNKIINGDFDIWLRATSQTSSGYGSDDRWFNAFIGGTLTHSRQTFALGQTEVSASPVWFSRSVVTHANGASNFHNKEQRIEGVRTLAGRRATLTFYAKADAPKNMATELYQFFGTGGSPSPAMTGIGSRLVALTTAWQKFTFTVDIPAIAGKTLGSNVNDYLGLAFWFDAGSSFNARAANLGQQSGTFDIAHVSLVEGDATAEGDPFSPRHPQQEEALCLRYAQLLELSSSLQAGSAGQGLQIKLPLPVPMRIAPSASVFSVGTTGNLTSLTPYPSRRSVTFEMIAAASGSAGVFNRTYLLDAEL